MAEEPRRCGCGDEVPPGRREPFCSSWCKGRAEQGLEPQRPPGLAPAFALVPLPSRPAAPPPAPPLGPVAERVTRTLEESGQGDSWQAAAALDLATSIDEGGNMSGSARAALHKELRALMGEALRGTVDTRSAVGRKRDELARRREQRAGGAS